MSSAISSSLTPTFDSPTCLILPSSLSSAKDHTESSKAILASLAQVLGATVGDPSTTRACQAALGGDDQVIRVGVERFRDQALGDLGTVGVCGVNEVHP